MGPGEGLGWVQGWVQGGPEVGPGWVLGWVLGWVWGRVRGWVKGSVRGWVKGSVQGWVRRAAPGRAIRGRTRALASPLTNKVRILTRWSHFSQIRDFDNASCPPHPHTKVNSQAGMDTWRSGHRLNPSDHSAALSPSGRLQVRRDVTGGARPGAAAAAARLPRRQIGAAPAWSTTPPVRGKGGRRTPPWLRGTCSACSHR